MRASAAAPRTRRTPMDRARYRAVARVSGVKPRLSRASLAFDAAVLAAAVLFALLAMPRIGGAVGTGIDDVGATLGAAFPAQQGTKPIDLPTAGGTVSATLSADAVPDFTRDPQLRLAGRVPSFAIAAGRAVRVTVNGAPSGILPLDPSGAFSTTVGLVEGPNAVELALVSGADVVAATSYTVVLDRQPPTLLVTKPSRDAAVDGPNVVVEGKAEAGATVLVNDRTVVPAQDGTFSDTFTAIGGPLAVTVVARDRAGNETKITTPVTVTVADAAAPLAVAVTLDKQKVVPGGVVTADIRVTANGLPKAGEQVTLAVGVITIGSAKTDAAGVARIGFAAPPNEGEAAVVVLASGAAGRATLTVAK